MPLKLNSTAFGKKVSIASDLRNGGEKNRERGVVTGFAQHRRDKQKQFHVEYTAADGRFVSGWFYEDQLTEI